MEGVVPLAKPFPLRWSDVTPQPIYLSRRHAIMSAVALGMLGTRVHAASLDDTPNDLETISSYNNFYEFGFAKTDPKDHAGSMTVDPWAVRIHGMVDRPGTYDLADIVKGRSLQERIYRLRCVEGWSMVIPWIGFPLSELLAAVGVQAGARYVSFETLARPEEMPGVAAGLLDFPYVEGLRLDEAMNPLTLMATGLYGQELPKQNGAPIRLVVPWKYGFKSIKSIVGLRLSDQQPPTTWQKLQPQEYGFYANVNPEVSHPRWSQASERRIGDGLFGLRRDTLMFNGYAEEVGDLYRGMDLAKLY